MSIHNQTKFVVAATLMALATITVTTACSPKPSSEENAAQTKALVEQAVAETKKDIIAEQEAEKARQEAAKAAAEETNKKAAAAAKARDKEYGVSTLPPPPPPMKRAVCENCGTVISVTEVEIEGKGSGLGAVGGGVVGGLLGNQVGQGTGRDLATIAGAVGGAIAGNKIEKKAKTTKSYDIVVKMESGEERIYRQALLPDLVGGDKVKIENETVVKQ